MNRLTTLVIFALVLCWSVCCVAVRSPYEILIENSTGLLIRDTHVSWEGFKSVGGSMSPGATAGHAFIRARLPPRVMVRWRTPDGVTHREEVEIPESVPRRFHGTLHFELFPDGHVEVRAEPPPDLR